MKRYEGTYASNYRTVTGPAGRTRVWLEKYLMNYFRLSTLKQSGLLFNENPITSADGEEIIL